MLPESRPIIVDKADSCSDWLEIHSKLTIWLVDILGPQLIFVTVLVKFVTAVGRLVYTDLLG